MCVRGDLQPLINKNNYIVILAYKIFRVLITITTAFDYETKWIDAVNVTDHTAGPQKDYAREYQAALISCYSGIYVLARGPGRRHVIRP
jgi:hypothetical protein